jgi:SAM-dependent methyltransferase
MTQGEITIWGETVPREIFSMHELEYLEPLTGMELPEVDWIWTEMDKVWENFKLKNNVSLDKQNISQFYSHPVWILNAFFTGADPASVSHREGIAKYIAATNARRIADYGGGGAELARRIGSECPLAEIEIIEPYPSPLGKHRIANMSNVHFTDKLNGKYDLVIAQDVLEHVEKPIRLAEEIYNSLSGNGIAIFANCFRPVIKCHLPGTFHLHNSFTSLMLKGGFEYLDNVPDVEHALVFRRTSEKPGFPGSVYLAERVSRVVFLVREFGKRIRQSLERMS